MAPKKGDKKASKDGDAEADRVHVVVRIRPPVRKDEKYGAGSESLQYDKEKNMLFLLAKEDDDKGVNPKQFAFDRVLWKDSVQYDAWEAAGLSVTNASLQGYTGCVMCYGQTGAGKTYTLANDKTGQEGVMIQAFNHIFTKAAEERELKYEIQLSYQQIYLDGISDLLMPSAPVELREDPKEGVYVSGARWESVSTTAEALNALKRGNDNRATAATKMNADSSRSHAVLILKIKCTGGVRTLNGMLYLVDLAGSERVKKSGVEGAAFDEAKAINQSLTTLGRCIEVLASNKKEKPPFRETKLTRLLSNAIGGAAKTTLVVCVAPTMTDQFETVNSLDFGQQAMNVVVRAKVNASTDYGSLTASLLIQRDMKQKPIRELELKLLKELAPHLDEVVNLELACKSAAFEVEVCEEKVDSQKDALAAAKAEGERSAERDEASKVDKLNERARKAEELEKVCAGCISPTTPPLHTTPCSLWPIVACPHLTRSRPLGDAWQVLLQLSNDPEMNAIQQEHETDKAMMTKKSMTLQEELRTTEHTERTARAATDSQTEGIVHTARNLGQLAAYFLQTGAMEEAADFYTQAKDLFDALLGPEHPKTVAWKEDLFFLINAPAIQSMVTTPPRLTHCPLTHCPLSTVPTLHTVPTHAPLRLCGHSIVSSHCGCVIVVQVTTAAKELAPESEAAASKVGGGEATEWWMQNLFDMGNHDAAADDDEGDQGLNWWMSNLYDNELQWSTMGTDPAAATAATSGEDDAFDQWPLLFGTPRNNPLGSARGGNASARGGKGGLTPRGTLAALSSARGRTGAAGALGMPLKKMGATEGAPAADNVNMGFASAWVEKVFMTPRGGGGEIDTEMASAAAWLHDTFDATPRVVGDMDNSRTPRMSSTPRASQPEAQQGLTQQADDAVFRAAMHATLATPRTNAAAAASKTMVDDAMATALSKSFESIFSGNRSPFQHV